MRVLLASNSLKLAGGSETYLVTLGRHLERLGHEVVVVEGQGPMGGFVTASGLLQVASPAELDRPPDRIVAQDAIVGAEAAVAWPSVPQVFVAHSTVHDFQLTDGLPSSVAALVALNDRVAAKAGALAAGLPVHRLRQPVDVGQFSLGPPPAASPRRLLLFGNNDAEWRADGLREACERRGVEVLRAGGSLEAHVAEPAGLLRSVDVVVGYGRCVLEAMACGRTALVADRFGSDGWVDAGSYPALEASGFTGTAGLDRPGRHHFDELLDAYDPLTGAAGHDLALRHHSARVHANEVVAILAGLGPVERADRDHAFALARVWRQQWHWELLAMSLQRELDGLRSRPAVDPAELERLREELDRLREELALLTSSPPRRPWPPATLTATAARLARRLRSLSRRVRR